MIALRGDGSEEVNYSRSCSPSGHITSIRRQQYRCFSIDDTSIPNNEVNTSTNNSASGASITITMYAVPDEKVGGFEESKKEGIWQQHIV